MYTCVGMILFVSHLGLGIVGYFFTDSMETFHIGETIPGYIIIFLRLVLLVLFWLGISRSLKETHLTGDVSAFLIQFRLLGACWFLFLPLTTIIGFFVAPYLRHQFCETFILISTVVTLIALTRLFLTQSAYTKISTMNASILPGGGMSKLK